MYLQHLTIENLRRIETAALDFGAGMHLVYGPNGSGKTTFLEAIHLLAGGRSFRTSRAAELISHDRARLLVTGRLVRDERTHTIGLEKSKRNTRFRLDGEGVRSASTVVRLMPVLVLNTESSRLLDGGPSNRRSLLDRLLFHVEPDYLGLIRGYYHLLKQRNVSLRRADSDAAVTAWDDQLAERGECIHRLRRRCVERLATLIAPFTAEKEIGDTELSYVAGWDVDKPLSEALGALLDRDRRLGNTSVGPHRAEIKALVAQKPAKSVLSRGQTKLLVTALIAAMAHLLEAQSEQKPILLVDDLAAELDPVSKSAAIQLLTSIKTQAFFTSIEYNSLIDHMTLDPRVFHVEQGVITVP